jgi:hypothetical protein
VDLRDRRQLQLFGFTGELERKMQGRRAKGRGRRLTEKIRQRSNGGKREVKGKGKCDVARREGGPRLAMQ